MSLFASGSAPIATASVPGLVKPGVGLSVAADGTLTATVSSGTATPTTLGTVEIDASPASGSPVALTVAGLRGLVPATARNGLLSVGPGPWDGTSAGHFTGSTSGSSLAINAVSGFAGNLVDLQVAGVSQCSVNSSGLVTTNQIAVTYGIIDIAGTRPYLDFTQGAHLLVNLRLAANTFGVRAVVNQSGDLQQWQDSSGNVLANISANGTIGVPTLTASSQVSAPTLTASSALNAQGTTLLGAPPAAIADASISNSQAHVWVNETASTLTFRVRTSTGVYKTATLTLA